MTTKHHGDFNDFQQRQRAARDENTLIEMAVQLAEFSGSDSRGLSESDVVAILFGTENSRSRQGFGNGMKRWQIRGLGFGNRGEQAGVIDDLVRSGLISRFVKGSRFIYSV